MAEPTLRWFHGGAAGLDVGCYVLPPFLTGAPAAGDFDPACRRDCVYVTSALREAQIFAGLAHGDVYEVEPRGTVRYEHDLSTMCTAALIVRVVERAAAGPLDDALHREAIERARRG